VEHKLITGGWQYLPFARSRIKAMRAAGLQYASQSFAIEGSFVRVRIVAGVDYIEISGGGCSFVMDSGVVSAEFRVAGDGRIYPQSYLPGVAYDSISTLAYKAAFTQTNASATLRLNPNAGSAGQFAGMLTKSSDYKGAVPVDTTPISFRPGSVIDRTVDPPTVTSIAADDALFRKKFAADSCPSSVFTGRCRLYVQALYGAPIYETDSNGVPTDKLIPVSIKPSYSQTPNLTLVAYVRQSDTVAYADITIGTNAGVYLHPQSGKHFLILPNIGTISASITVYPLIASACGEAQRKTLAAGGLGPDDSEKLEAYILSTCRPDVKNATTYSASTITEGSAMGYGFHWSWSGTTADVVTNSSFTQYTSGGHEYRAMRSTHHRLSVATSYNAETGVVSFSFSRAVVEGPSDWAVSRVHWCITQPDWFGGGQEKVTPKYSALFTCDAPFYVFYVRDTIHVCRVEVTSATTTPEITTTSPYWNQGYGYVRFTVGMDSGFSSVLTQPAGYDTARFYTTQSAGIAGLHLGWETLDTREDVSAKAFSGDITTGYVVPGYITPGSRAPSLFQIDDGYPLHPLIDNEYNVQSLMCFGTVLTRYPVTYSYSKSVVWRQQLGLAEIVVPRYDAEAIFMRGQYDVNTSTTYSEYTTLLSTRYVSNSFFRVTDGYGQATPEIGYLRYVYAQQGSGDTVTGTTIPPVSYTSASTASEQLVCRAGSVPAVFPGLTDFHDNDLETVSASYAIRTSNGVNPVVIGPGYITAPIGISTSPTFPVMLGWV
jgi:hypothetical protein